MARTAIARTSLVVMLLGASATLAPITTAGTPAEFGGGNSPQNQNGRGKSRPAVVVERFEESPMGRRWDSTPPEVGNPVPDLFFSFVPDGTNVPDFTAAGIPGSAGPSELYTVLNGRIATGPTVWTQIFIDAVGNTFRLQAGELPEASDFLPVGTGWSDISGAKVALTAAEPPPDPPITVPPTPPTPDLFFRGEVDTPLSAWGQTNLDLANFRGHIRIAMRPAGPATVLAWVIPPGGGVAGTADDGDILINSNAFRIPGGTSNPLAALRRIAGFCFGRALGLQQACPDNGTKVMERGIPAMPLMAGVLGVSNADQDNPAYHFPDIFLVPDDQLAVQRLYGDYFENNDTPAQADNAADIDERLTQIPGGVTFAGLSIDRNVSMMDRDVDYYRVDIPESDLEQEVTVRVFSNPTIYQFAPFPGAGPCPGTTMTIDPSLVMDLKISIIRVGAMGAEILQPVNSGAPDCLPPSSGPPVAAVVDCINPGDPSYVNQEFIRFIPVDPGTVYIKVEADGMDGVLPYTMVATLGPSASGMASPVAPILDMYGIASFTDRGIFGENSSILVMDGEWTVPDHLVFENIVPEDPMDPPSPRPEIAYFEWSGTVLNPNPPRGLTGTNAIAVAHATAVTGLAAGSPFGQFSGLASRARIASGSVARQVTPGGGFFLSREALYFNLFGSQIPANYIAAGLLSKPSVILSVFGTLSDPFGEGTNAQAYDAAVSMLGVPIVCAAGNAGEIDSTTTCMGPGGDTVGGQFRGARGIIEPATAYNVITVGYSGFDVPSMDVPPIPGEPEPPPAQNTLVSTSSSKGPLDAIDWVDGSIDRNVRPGLHLIAPGTGLIEPPQLLGGGRDCPAPSNVETTRLNLPTIDAIELESRNDFSAQDGSSFGAAFAAGCVVLLHDAAGTYDDPTTVGPDPKSRIPIVLKAILLNSARKQNGWSNSGQVGTYQDSRDGREEIMDLIADNTTQVLDNFQGAGLIDIGRAYDQYLLNPVVVDDMGEVVDGDIDLPNGGTKDVPLTDPRFGYARAVPRVQLPGQLLVSGPPVEPSLDETLRKEIENGIDLARVDDLSPGAMEIASKLLRVQNLARSPDFAYGQRRRPDLDPPLRPGSGGSPPGTGIGGIPVDPPTGIDFPGPGQPTSPSGPVIELAGAIGVEKIGWDLGRIGVRSVSGAQPGFPNGNVGYVDYVLGPIFGNETLDVTLVWNRTLTIDAPNFTTGMNPGGGRVRELELENLDLEIFESDSFGNFPGFQGPVYSSRSRYSTVEHIRDGREDGTFGIGADCDSGIFLTIRVRWIASVYDLFGNLPQGDVEYALAWRVAPQENPDNNPCIDFGLQTLAAQLQGFNRSYGQPGYDRRADLNSDARINLQDLAYLIANWRD